MKLAREASRCRRPLVDRHRRDGGGELTYTCTFLFEERDEVLLFSLLFLYLQLCLSSMQLSLLAGGVGAKRRHETPSFILCT